MLNAVAGSIGLVVQAALFGGVYLGTATARGRSLALLYAGVVAVDGYALLLLGAMTIGVPWQVANPLLLLVTGAALALSPRLRAVLRRTTGAALVLLRGGWGAILIVLVVVLFQLFVVALTPELSIDGQLYHGPTLAEMVQHGTVWGWTAPNQYMYYSDLAMVGAINLATFTGAAIFDNGAQIPHLILLVLAISAALRLRFARAWVRVAFAVLIVSAPVIWIQARILYVDIAYGAAVAAAIVLIVTVKHCRAGDVLVAGIACAAILAVKPTGVLTSAVMVVVLVLVAIWRRRRTGRRWRRSVGATLAVVALPFVFGLGFYIRNLATFDNPVYPVKASVGSVVLPGIVDLGVFMSGSRGSGLVDPGRWASYGASILNGVGHGVTKLDYDPRSGGYGYLPLMIVALAAALVIVQLVGVFVSKARVNRSLRGNLLVQAGMIALAAAVILIQPSSFDSRYVIGPTAVACTAVLLTTLLRPAPLLVDAIAGGVALVLATGQIAWTETMIYPGLKAIHELRTLSDRWQPVTPGDPWGRGRNVAWLPNDPSTCSTIVVQTAGGVGRSGVIERTALSTLPYGLYGAALCNTVIPVQLSTFASGQEHADPLPTADYLLLYSNDVATWEALRPQLATCWRTVQTIAATQRYPQAVTVLTSECGRPR